VVVNQRCQREWTRLGSVVCELDSARVWLGFPIELQYSSGVEAPSLLDNLCTGRSPYPPLSGRFVHGL